MVGRRDKSHFGWKGFGKDPTRTTTIAICVCFVNYLLFAYAASALLVAVDPSEPWRAHRFIDSPPTMVFYMKAGAAFLVSTFSALLIQSPETETRWGARFFACGLPACAALALIDYGYAI